MALYHTPNGIAYTHDPCDAAEMDLTPVEYRWERKMPDREDSSSYEIVFVRNEMEAERLFAYWSSLIQRAGVQWTFKSLSSIGVNDTETDCSVMKPARHGQEASAADMNKQSIGLDIKGETLKSPIYCPHCKRKGNGRIVVKTALTWHCLRCAWIIEIGTRKGPNGAEIPMYVSVFKEAVVLPDGIDDVVKRKVK